MVMVVVVVVVVKVVVGGDGYPWRRKRQQHMRDIGISQAATVVGGRLT